MVAWSFLQYTDLYCKKEPNCGAPAFSHHYICSLTGPVGQLFASRLWGSPSRPWDVPTLLELGFSCDVTSRPTQNIHKIFRPLWQFSTVTFQPKVGRIVCPPQKWIVCHSVTLRPAVILANPWLWPFAPFWFWFLLCFLPFKRLAWNLRLFRDYSTRFSDPGRILVRDVW